MDSHCLNYKTNIKNYITINTKISPYFKVSVLLANVQNTSQKLIEPTDQWIMGRYGNNFFREDKNPLSKEMRCDRGQNLPASETDTRQVTCTCKAC